MWVHQQQGVATAATVFPDRKPGDQGVACKTIRFSGDWAGQRRDISLSLFFTGAHRKLMSYNAEQLYRSSIGHWVKPQKSREALAKVILEEDPDVLALQEVGGREDLALFNRQYLQGRYPTIVSFDVSNGYSLKVAILAKEGVELVDAKSHWEKIANGDPDSGKRDFLEATFRTETGHTFTVYNLHFKSMAGGGERKTQPTRMEEAAVASRIVARQLKQTPDADVFVTGDLNTIHNSRYGKPVVNKISLRDDANPDNNLVEVMLKDNRDHPTCNGKGYYPNRKLDYTFASPAVAKRLIKSYVSGKFHWKPWSVASDHLPLITIFEEPDTLPAAMPAETSARKSSRKPLSYVA